jgi:purine-binding chemotaxis protein CheW
VDSVSQVFKIPKESIEVAPSLSEEQANVIRNVANIGNQGRMILLLDVTHLLDIKETNKLASMAA